MQNGGVTSSTDTTNGAYARARAEGRGGVHEFSPCLPLVTPPPCLPLNRIHTSPPKKGTILHNKHKQTLHLKVDGITPGNLTTRLLYIQTHTHTHTHTHNMACAGDCCGAVAQHWRQRQRRWQRRKARTIAGAGTKINFEKKWRLSQRAKHDGRAMWPWCARHAGRGRAHGRGPASLGRGTGHGGAGGRWRLRLLEERVAAYRCLRTPRSQSGPSNETLRGVASPEAARAVERALLSDDSEREE